MKRATFVAAMLVVSSMLVGCSGKGSFAEPSAVQDAFVAPASRPVVTSGKVSPKAIVAGAGLDFSTSQLGRVTVTNVDSVAHRFAFYVWDASDEVNQVLKARDQRTIAPGETAVITVGFEQTCGTKYQRDVYLDIPNYDGATTSAEVNNYFYGAPGVFWQTEAGKCDVTPEPPPPTRSQEEPRCENHEANNYGGYLPCTFGEGGIEPPPPSEPQKFLFCHVDVNVTGGKNPKTVVHEQQVGGVNGIPLSAIQAAHNAEPFHGVTTEHFYDYYGVCDGRGIGQQ